MSRNRSYDLRKIARRAKAAFYRQRAILQRVGFHYPDRSFSYEIQPCIWNEGKEDERRGWPSCTLQLVCPYVGNYRYNSDGSKIIGALGRCQHECKDPQIREAIEAFCSLHPEIM